MSILVGQYFDIIEKLFPQYMWQGSRSSCSKVMTKLKLWVYNYIYLQKQVNGHGQEIYTHTCAHSDQNYMPLTFDTCSRQYQQTVFYCLLGWQLIKPSLKILKWVISSLHVDLDILLSTLSDLVWFTSYLISLNHSPLSLKSFIQTCNL